MDLKKLEDALALIEKKDYKKAITLLGKLYEKSEDLYLKKKCLSYIGICNNKMKTVTGSNNEPYTEAVFHLNNGNLEEAESILQELTIQNKNNDTYHYILAICFAMQENPEKALTCISKSVEINPTNKYLALNNGDLSIIHNSIKDL